MKKLIIVVCLFVGAYAQGQGVGSALDRFKAEQEAKKAKNAQTPEERAKAWNDRIKNERDYGGAGEKPKVTKEELTPAIKNYFLNNAKNADNFEFIWWTLPEIQVSNNQGQNLGHWRMFVKIRGANSYGEKVVNLYEIWIKNGAVTTCLNRKDL